MFFGSAINNFGVRRCWTRWSTWRRRRLAPRHPARGAARRTKFSGVVFKIQANMDPAHRDRIAFVRVASGRFERGMNLKVVRSGKLLRCPNTVVTFMSQRASCSTRPSPATSSAFPTTACCSSATRDRGRGAAVHRPALLRAGDVPHRRGADPLRTKQLRAGLTQLGEEGAIQVFRPCGRLDAAARRGRPAAVRGGGAPARARVRRARHASSRRAGNVARWVTGSTPRPASASSSASSTTTRTAWPTTRSTRPACCSNMPASCARCRELAEDQVPRAARARGPGVPNRSTPERASGFDGDRQPVFVVQHQRLVRGDLTPGFPRRCAAGSASAFGASTAPQVPPRARPRHNGSTAPAVRARAAPAPWQGA